MRIVLLLAVFCWAAQAGAAVPQDEARAIIEKAVNAQGGLDALSQPGSSRSKIKGSFFGNTEFSGEIHNGGAGKLRLTMDFKEQGRRLVILNGDKGWVQFNGVTQEMGEELLDRNLKARYIDRVCGLVNLLKDKRYTFTLLDESKVDDKPAVSVKVASEGQPDVTLFFDKASGFLVKSVFRQLQPGGKQEAMMEAYYRDYQLVDHASEPEKTLRDAQRSLETPALLTYLRENIPSAETRKEIQALIDRLGDGSFAARERASGALLKHGIKAGALLRKASASSDIEVSRRAAKCLELLAPECDLAAAVVRLIAVRKVAAAEALLAYLPWAPNEEVAREVDDALHALIKRQTAPDPIWEKVSQDNEPRIRQLAAAALGKDGGAYLAEPGHRLFVEGLRLARSSSTFMDGQKRLDMETLERVYFNRLDDAMFEAPANDN